MSRAHARVRALQKDQEQLIEVVLAKLKVLLVANNAHAVRQQSLAKTRYGRFAMPVKYWCE